MMRSIPVALVVALSAAACAPNAGSPADDQLGIARFNTYEARRSSSDNRYMLSNDDAKHIMPGETLVIADLQGPGMVTHIWVTGAANEFAWPRLFRLRVYYDGSKTPSVDAPLGDFFGVGHGYERELKSTMVHDSRAWAARATATGRCRSGSRAGSR